MQLFTRNGDATYPAADGPKIIAHVCNDIGQWGAGFTGAVSRRWDEPEAAYRRWYAAGAAHGFMLGGVQFVKVEPDLWVANMIAQRGTGWAAGPPIRYDALRQCLGVVASKALAMTATVHMPRIGCGLAGGNWEQVSPLLVGTLGVANVPTYVYDFAARGYGG